MKRIYKNNDLTFNLSINDFPYKPELIDTVEFKFYTVNRNNCIKKSKADIKDGAIILEWSEMANFEQGVLNFSYNLGINDTELGDKSNNSVVESITDYFIVTGIDPIEIETDITNWGDIQGELVNQKDLVDYINIKLDNIDLTPYALKTDLPTKNSQLENDSKYLVAKDIEGKLDKSIYDTEKLTFADKDTTNSELGKKADKTYVDGELDKKAATTYVNEELAKKQDTLVSGTNIKTINAESLLGEGNIETVGRIDTTPDSSRHGEVFNDYINNKSIGTDSHAEGYSTTASGIRGSHAEGSWTTASGGSSHAEGAITKALGHQSHAEGSNTEARGENSHAEGSKTESTGRNSHAEGTSTVAGREASHAEGVETTAIGYASHAEGEGTSAFNYCHHALGMFNAFEGEYSPDSYDATKTIFSIGNGKSNTDRSDALKMLGNGTTWISGIGTFTGKNAKDNNSLQAVLNSKLNITDAVGKIDTTPDATNHGEVFGDYVNNKATGEISHAEGFKTTASGGYSHAEGANTLASNYHAHAEGANTKATGPMSHAEGNNNLSKGYVSHTEGQQNEAIGDYSHAEGCECVASKNYSHAEGYKCKAESERSHAEGFATETFQLDAHSEGCITKAKGKASHSEGDYTVAENFAQHSQGIYNTIDSSVSPKNYNANNTLFNIGNGTEAKRSDALRITGEGNLWIQGALNQNTADYAEMFEWSDGNIDNEDRVGYFVTLNGDKIVKATSKDSYILGIVSSAPAVIGDNPNLWHGQYINDEWGRPIYEDVEVKYMDYETNENGESIEVEKTRIDHIRKINPDWDATKPYLDRTERKEWSAIGLMGKLLVRQDGTLKVGGYCKTNDNGIATDTTEGFYVMKVNNKNQALIMFK